MELIRIIKAKLRNKNKITDSWYHERLEICNKCPFNSKNTVGKKDLRHRVWEFLNLKEHFCTICGCEIKAKASESMEECSMSEIGQEPKWKQKSI